MIGYNAAMEARHKGMAAGVAALWGGNFVAAKIALGVLGPFTLLGIRFVLVLLCLSPLLVMRPRPARLGRVALLSSVLCVLHFGLMFGALRMGLDVATGVVTTQLGIPFSCLLGWLFYRERIGPRRLLGMLISFAGIIAIAGQPSGGILLLPFAVSCGAALAWASANLLMKRIGQIDVLPLLAWLALFAIPQYALLVALFDPQAEASVMNAGFAVWAALLYTVLCSTILAYGMWYWLLARFPVSQVAPFGLLVPVFGLLAAQVAFGKPMTLHFVVGGALTLLGVAMIVLQRRAALPPFAR